MNDRIRPQPMDEVDLRLTLDGHAGHLEAVLKEGLDGVSVSVEGDRLDVQITAPTLRRAQELADAVLAMLSSAEASA
jgi:hypothetical protein